MGNAPSLTPRRSWIGTLIRPELLIIDPDLSWSARALGALDGRRFRVLVAPYLFEGARIARRRKITIVTVAADLLHPASIGFLRRIRKDIGRGARLYVLAETPRLGPTESALQAGADDVLRRPLDATSLEETIARGEERRRLRRRREPSRRPEPGRGPFLMGTLSRSRTPESAPA